MSEKLTEADRAPGFWPEYQEPRSHVSRLIQGPLARIDGDRLTDAYMRDFWDSRRRALADRSKA